METEELLQKVREIEIKTKGLSSNIFAGEYHSAFKAEVWLLVKCVNTNMVTMFAI